MKTATGTYYLDGIKYFHPDIKLNLTCPKCKAEDVLDLYDYGIEYPKSKEVLTVECVICGSLLRWN